MLRFLKGIHSDNVVYVKKKLLNMRVGGSSSPFERKNRVQIFREFSRAASVNNIKLPTLAFRCALWNCQLSEDSGCFALVHSYQDHAKRILCGNGKSAFPCFLAYNRIERFILQREIRIHAPKPAVLRFQSFYTHQNSLTSSPPYFTFHLW